MRSKPAFIINSGRFSNFSIILSVAFYLFIAILGLVHTYTYNEILDDHGCSVGSLFCHVQIKYSSTISIYSPFRSFESVILLVPSFIFTHLAYIHPKRGPPVSFFLISS